MKKFVAGIFALTALTFAGGVAAADKGSCGGKHRGGKHVMKNLIKAGAVTKEEVAALKPLWKEARACRKGVKAGTSPKGSCKEKFAAVGSAKLQLLEGALPKVTDAKLKERVEKHIARIKARAAKSGA